MIFEINNATLAAALNGEEAALEQLAFYAEKRLRQLATELAERFLDGGRSARPELLRMTLGEIPLALQRHPKTLDELVDTLAQRLRFNVGVIGRQQAVGDGAGDVMLRVVWGEELDELTCEDQGLA